MTDAKHTPAPLIVGFYVATPEFRAIAEHVAVMKPDGSLIAVTGNSTGPNRERTIADAQVMCFAGELLDAVDALEKAYDFSKLVYDVRDVEMQGWTGPRVTSAGAAIAVITNVLRKAGRR